MEDGNGRKHASDGQFMRESRPQPDPTELTTEALQREVSALKELIELRIEGLSELTDRQFNLVEKQRVEQKLDTKSAVDAALAAAKEAVGKAELSTADQLSQLTTTFNTAIGGVTTLLTDVKDRVGVIESTRQGAKDSVAGLYAAIAAVGIALTAATTIIVIVN